MSEEISNWSINDTTMILPAQSSDRPSHFDTQDGPVKERGGFNFVDLARPRKIIIRQGSLGIEYSLKPVPEAAWFRYFDRIVSTAERDGKQVVQHTDASSAGVALVEEMLSHSGGSTGISLAHKLAIASVLTSAFSPSIDGRAGETDLGPEAVRLHCIWGAGDGDAMRRYKNLVHLFETPTAEQNRRYRRDDSRAQIVSGSRRGITIFKGAQRTLAALYDELIVSVAGYAVNGVALEGREEIARHMDAYHKVAAAAQLFAPAELEMEEEEE
ncbi:MAG: hypothetical protein ACLQG3_14685 [Terracidiphilus sp.]